MSSLPRVIGRYAIFDEIASGGQASVHVGRLTGAMGFSKTVAIKLIRAEQGASKAALDMLADEARLASRVQHPNVVPVLDVVSAAGELMLVLEYVQGESLARLIRAAGELGELVPVRVATAIVAGALRGVHAAHQARDEQGRPLELVHRDLSPQNIMVDLNGVARVLDFGVAKARNRVQEQTRDGALKGKIAYMAPEQFRGQAHVGSDVWAMGVVLWEALAGGRLFTAEDEASLIGRVMVEPIDGPRGRRPEVPAPLEAVVLKALAREPSARFASADEMAAALEACEPASPGELAAWVKRVAASSLQRSAQLLQEVESSGLALGDARSTSGRDGAPTLPTPKPRRRRWALAAVAGAGVFASAGAWVLWLRHASAPTASGASLSVSTNSTPAGRSIEVEAPSPAPDAGHSSEVEAPSPAGSPTEPEREKAMPAPDAGTRAGPAKAVARRRLNCTPPFELDAAGHKRWKRECF